MAHKQRSMLVLALLVLAPVLAIRGVAPAQESLYKPDENNQWACLGHPEIKLDFSKVNDDFCDCPDGLDEPGTSACKEGKFYCENKGFKPSYIPSFKVNDGVCDYEFCCDGSDEWATDAGCEDRCVEMAQQYEKAKAEKFEKLSQGLAIKAQLLSKVQARDAELEKEIEDQSQAVLELNDAVYQLKKEVKALNTEYNKEAMEFLEKIKSEHKEPEIQTKISNLISAIDLVKLGVDKNSEKTSLAREILNALASDFDHNINDLVVKKNIESYEKFESEDALKDFDELYSAYSKQVDIMKKDLALYSPYIFLEKNQDHLALWRNFIWTRKSSLHAALLKVLLLQDETTKKLEAMMEDIEKNYNPNFNNEVVKLALKGIESYNKLKAEVQENVLGKIDYVKDYDGAVREVMSAVEQLQREVGFEVKPVQEIEIDNDHNEEELKKIQEDRTIQKTVEAEKVIHKPLPRAVWDSIVYAVEDFLGVYDNLPEKKDPVLEAVAYDAISNKIDQINDLSSGEEGSGEYSEKLRSLNAQIAAKSEEIAQLNQHVAELSEELKDSTNHYGPQKILKAVEGEKFTAPIGEYEYEIDFTGEIRQTGNGQSALIGRYNGNIRELAPTRDGETKLEMEFDRGAKCWSGPIRKAKVTVFCGDKVQILKVTEPEVCQYFIEVSSPLACFEKDLE